MQLFRRQMLPGRRRASRHYATAVKTQSPIRGQTGRLGTSACFPKFAYVITRPTGTADCSVYRARFRGGMGDYFMGYHPVYRIREIHPPRFGSHPTSQASLLRLYGYIRRGGLSSETRLVPVDVVRFLRQWQMERLMSAGGTGAVAPAATPARTSTARRP